MNYSHSWSGLTTWSGNRRVYRSSRDPNAHLSRSSRCALGLRSPCLARGPAPQVSAPLCRSTRLRSKRADLCARGQMRFQRIITLRCCNQKSGFFAGKVARPERVELPTFWFVAKRSIQLSYGRAETPRALLLDYDTRAATSTAEAVFNLSAPQLIQTSRKSTARLPCGTVHRTVTSQ
jgi:hypothetical protein